MNLRPTSRPRFTLAQVFNIRHGRKGAFGHGTMLRISAETDGYCFHSAALPRALARKFNEDPYIDAFWVALPLPVQPEGEHH